MTEFEHAHTSSLGERGAAALEQTTDALVAGGATLVTGTEVYTARRARALRERFFRHIGGAGDDAWAMWAASEWTAVAADRHLTTRRFFFRRGGKRKTNEVVVLVLDHVSGFRLLQLVNHLPSSTEGGGSKEGIFDVRHDLRRVLVTRSAVAGMRRIKRRYVKTFRPDAQSIWADWNLNLDRLLVRAWLKVQFPRMTPTFRPRQMDGHGTLVRRWIDFGLVKGLGVVGEPEVEKTPSSDHWLVRLRMRFTGEPGRGRRR